MLLGDAAHAIVPFYGQGANASFEDVESLVDALASNPDDLDAMDESVPFTKSTLDNLLGVQSDEANFRHYFEHFSKAQKARTFLRPGRPGGRPRRPGRRGRPGKPGKPGRPGRPGRPGKPGRPGRPRRP